MFVDVNKFHYLYFMHLYIHMSEKGSVGFTRFSEGSMARTRLRTLALVYGKNVECCVLKQALGIQRIQ